MMCVELGGEMYISRRVSSRLFNNACIALPERCNWPSGQVIGQSVSQSVIRPIKQERGSSCQSDGLHSSLSFPAFAEGGEKGIPSHHPFWRSVRLRTRSSHHGPI